MSRESIVEKILSDAQLRADSFIEEQTGKAGEIIAASAEECKLYCYKFKSETDKMIADLEARSQTVAELEVRKLQLASKARLLDAVFARALEMVKSLDNDACKELLIGMLDEAEDGDVITLGKNQAGILTKHDVDGVAKQKGISLTLSKATGDFDGMIISGKGVDKNLTFDVEIALLREEIEMQIAKELFD